MGDKGKEGESEGEEENGAKGFRVEGSRKESEVDRSISHGDNGFENTSHTRFIKM